jgi:hypothetical protein
MTSSATSKRAGMTLRRFVAGLETIPAATAWYLADLNREAAAIAEETPQNMEELGA